MELQFSQKSLPYLHRAVWECKNEEQTQEVKLADSLPDIGRILGAWGQPLVRSKEWRGSSMGVSGGVMVWILYAPEEGTLQCVKTWIPFQSQWEFPQTQRDGVMRVSCLLKAIDARTISARKMIVRAVVSTMGEALEPTQAEVYEAMEVPADVQLRKQTYPVCLAVEAGEKRIVLDEAFTPEDETVAKGKILHGSVLPEISELKVMADKLVFRGSAKVHVACAWDDTIKSYDFEIPFSQYAELEREYGSAGGADIIPAVTNLEMDIQESGALRLKMEIIGQYMVYEKPDLEVITDAYSTKRAVTLHRQSLALPDMVQIHQETIPVELETEVSAGRMIQSNLSVGHPTMRKAENGCHLELPGNVQILAQDEDGNLEGLSHRCQKEWDIPDSCHGQVLARCSPKGKTQAAPGGIRGEVTVNWMVTSQTDIPMVTTLEVGEVISPDSERPSLILQRKGSDSLWDIAKACLSTVDAIREANGLSDEPLDDQVLLIPVS